MPPGLAFLKITLQFPKEFLLFLTFLNKMTLNVWIIYLIVYPVNFTFLIPMQSQESLLCRGNFKCDIESDFQVRSYVPKLHFLR